MGFIHITIEKVVLAYDDKKLMKLLERIEQKLDKVADDPDGTKKKEIMSKLDKVLDGIKKTV